jgi:hypothetical protein
MKKTMFIVLIINTLLSINSFAQGPPITLDKPIMLGEKKGTVRPMFKIINSDTRSFKTFIADADYNFTNNLATMIEVPFTFGATDVKAGLGDIAVGLKYQFYTKNGMGKTLRIAAKAKNMFATGKKLETPIIGMGHNMTYVGILAARESLKFGVQAELGYNIVPSATHLGNLDYKLGFGLPCFEAVYPVDQLNLYFEFEGMNMQKHLGENQYAYYYAQGIQYAKNIYTYDLSLQFPLKQQVPSSYQRNFILLLGMRVII